MKTKAKKDGAVAVGCGGWLASLRRLRGLTVRRPGGGRLDEYSRGYDQAMADFAAAIRKEVAAANGEAGRSQAGVSLSPLALTSGWAGQ